MKNPADVEWEHAIAARMAALGQTREQAEQSLSAERRAAYARRVAGYGAPDVTDPLLE